MTDLSPEAALPLQCARIGSHSRVKYARRTTLSAANLLHYRRVRRVGCPKLGVSPVTGSCVVTRHFTQYTSGEWTMSSTKSFIRGVTLGAGVMYLMDSERGRARREQVSRGISQLLSQARRSFQPVSPQLGSAG